MITIYLHGALPMFLFDMLICIALIILLVCTQFYQETVSLPISVKITDKPSRSLTPILALIENTNSA